MIHSKLEYHRALAFLERDAEAMAVQRANLRKMGIEGKGLERAMQPMECFHLQLAEEIQEYTRVKPMWSRGG